MNVKDGIKELTRGTTLYGPLRDSYFRLFNRQERNRRKDRVAFYAQFVPKGDLVFDIGANIGEYTEAFLKLGARVVAVEPNPECVKILKTIRPSAHLTVEAVAIGAKAGEAVLRLCEDHGLSTTSPEWFSALQSSSRLSWHNWNRAIQVRLTTLDRLIAKYGEPSFIKIDVEGSEEAVLSGLTRAPRFLSFEFQSEFISSTTSCLAKSCFSKRSRFNLFVANSREFVFPQWIPREELIEYLEKSGLRRTETFGEIFACERP
ncbi:MAG TPA: FkbM family methyltransferase [Blastocatellia bacterium]|nr:FkbM family methyltransferase [Blastocatellia bacterium]